MNLRHCYDISTPIQQTIPALIEVPLSPSLSITLFLRVLCVTPFMSLCRISFGLSGATGYEIDLLKADKYSQRSFAIQG